MDLLSGLWSKVFADRGYVSAKLASDKLLSRKRSIVQTVIDQLKNISQIEHSRHRSPTNCFVIIICGLIAYCHQPKKPRLHLEWALPGAA